MSNKVHPSHKTRFSDASSFDEICVLCKATDEVPGGVGRLAFPCTKSTNNQEFRPQRYALAYCAGGLLGLITSEQPMNITYRPRETGIAWTGQQVTGGTIKGIRSDEGKTFAVAPGTPWSSRNPRVIAQLSEEDGRALEAELNMLKSKRISNE